MLILDLIFLVEQYFPQHENFSTYHENLSENIISPRNENLLCVLRSLCSQTKIFLRKVAIFYVDFRGFCLDILMQYSHPK